MVIYNYLFILFAYFLNLFGHPNEKQYQFDNKNYSIFLRYSQSIPFTVSIFCHFILTYRIILQMHSSFNQKNTKQTDILILRHARSLFNVGEEQFSGKSFSEEVLYSPKYIDARLSSHGEEQCLKARNNSIINSVQIVLVSPLTRALQTAQLVFGGKGILIVVRPELTESFRYGCDLSGPLEDKPKEFPSFDFQAVAGYKQHWQINNILGQNNKKIFSNWLSEHPKSTFREQQVGICRLIGQDALVERDEELRGRVGKIKNMLKGYRQKYDKVAIVSHYYTLGYLLTEKFNKDSYPMSMPGMENARPMWVSLAKLLLTK